MGRWRKNSREIKIRNELEIHFQERKRMTIEEALDEYFEPKTTYQALLAKQKMKMIFASIKRRFMKEGIVFGCINDMDEWGLPMDEDEFRYMGISRYKLVKGIVRNTSMILGVANKRGYLLDGRSEDVTIVRLNGGEDEDSDK